MCGVHIVQSAPKNVSHLCKAHRKLQAERGGYFFIPRCQMGKRECRYIMGGGCGLKARSVGSSGRLRLADICESGYEETAK